MHLPRLRQVVLAASDLDAVAQELETALGVSRPFVDEGVGHFGLRNAVYAVGDMFVEIVSPVAEGTAAGRQIQRRGGDCGYMAMFELADATQMRARLDRLGTRIVWETAHDDIVDLHLHPKDIPGAIVAVDATTPAGSWRWGGPAWTATIPAHDAGGLAGLTVAVLDPEGAADRWAAVLGLDADGHVVDLADGGQRIRFVAASDDSEQGIVGVDVSVPDRTGPVTIAGVTFDRRPTEATGAAQTRAEG
jgi:hypothetical protein